MPKPKWEEETKEAVNIYGNALVEITLDFIKGNGLTAEMRDKKYAEEGGKLLAFIRTQLEGVINEMEDELNKQPRIVANAYISNDHEWIDTCDYFKVLQKLRAKWLGKGQE